MRDSYRSLSRIVLISSVVAASFAPAAFAQQSPTGGVSLRAGVGEHFKRLELAWESPSLWNYQFSGDKGRLDLTAELGAAYWKADGSRTPSNVWQFSAIPMLRWTVQERYFIEAGVGPTVFTSTHFSNKNIGSAFQFGSQLGVGMYLSPQSRLGLRVAHVSNAGIKHPNPGMEWVQLTYSYQY